MHKTALNNTIKFYKNYCENNIEQKNILDIGALDGGNGSMRPIFAKAKQYVGLDLQPGNNVDIIGDAHNLPFDNESFDIIISSSCFEHDPFFWISFLEMSRVVKTNGYIYVCAPSAGPYHPEKCPGDSWRFYPDSWKSLCEWSIKNKYNLKLVESYIDNTYYPPDENWKDSIGIYQKI